MTSTSNSPITTIHSLHPDTVGPVEVTVTRQGQGRPYLLLHGGAGPQSMQRFAVLLAETQRADIIMPTHPGFMATPRPESLRSVQGLAALYISLLDDLDVREVTVIGNSVGGWIAAEMALLDSTRIGRIVLMNATGIHVPDHPIADVSAMNIDQILAMSYHNPTAFRIDPSTMTPESLAIAAGNRSTLAIYGGPTSSSSDLRERLSHLAVPTLVLWGESDRIVEPGYGRAYRDAIPNAEFHLLAHTGHMPHIESPDLVLSAVLHFVDADIHGIIG